MIIKTNIKQQGLKLENFLFSKFPNSNLNDIRRFIRNNEIKVNDKKTKTNYKLFDKDTIKFSSFVEKILYNPDKKIKVNIKKVSDRYINLIKKSVIYEDENLFVINKPYGLPVQGGSGIKVSIADIIKQISHEKESYKLVHRLDKETTGVLIIAKNIEYANELKNIFKNKKDIKKNYLALVYGNLKNKSGNIDYPLLKKYENGTEKVYVDKELGKEAVTKYRVLKYYEKYDMSLVDIEILTGRTHQIRVHFKEIGHPIVGDYKYGKNKNIKNKISNKLYLHSASIEVVIFGRCYRFRASMPDDWF